MSQIDALRLQVIETDIDEARRLLGEVDFGADGFLVIANAELENGELLKQLVEIVNSKPSLYMATTPPAGAARFERHAVSIARSDALFFPALQAFLARHYGVILSLGGPIDLAPLPATELPAEK
jgi:hypothetical protein